MNISYRQLLTEAAGPSNSYGCLMARVTGTSAQKLINFNQRIISDSILYVKGSEFGREKEPHVTVKYGFQPDLNELQIRSVLKGVKPFNIDLIQLSLFDNNPDYDVVKFDVRAPQLTRLHEQFSKFPNHDEYPVYHPHLTLAYVQKGKFVFNLTPQRISVKIDTLYYSPIVEEYSYFKL